MDSLFVISTKFENPNHGTSYLNDNQFTLPDTFLVRTYFYSSNPNSYKSTIYNYTTTVSPWPYKIQVQIVPPETISTFTPSTDFDYGRFWYSNSL